MEGRFGSSIQRTITIDIEAREQQGSSTSPSTVRYGVIPILVLATCTHLVFRRHRGMYPNGRIVKHLQHVANDNNLHRLATERSTHRRTFKLDPPPSASTGVLCPLSGCRQSLSFVRRTHGIAVQQGCSASSGRRSTCVGSGSAGFKLHHPIGRTFNVTRISKAAPTILCQSIQTSPLAT